MGLLPGRENRNLTHKSISHSIPVSHKKPKFFSPPPHKSNKSNKGMFWKKKGLNLAPGDNIFTS